MIALAAIVAVQAITSNLALVSKVESLVQHHADRNGFEQIVDFELWWYMQPASYRHALDRHDAAIVAKLLSEHETTFAAAAILFKSPGSLNYVSDQLDKALARETADRKAWNLPIAPSSGWEEYKALRCLKHLRKTGETRQSDCKLIAGVEEEFLSKQH